MIFFIKCFLTDDGLHGSSVLADGVGGVEFIGDFGMVDSCHDLLCVIVNTDCGFHETREGGENVNGRINLLIVELTIDEDLSFSDVSSQIGDRVSDIIIGH